MQSCGPPHLPVMRMLSILQTRAVNRERSMNLAAVDAACEILRDSGRYAETLECRERALFVLNLLQNVHESIISNEHHPFPSSKVDRQRLRSLLRFRRYNCDFKQENL